MKLKESSNHLKAFEFSEEKHDFDRMEIIFQVLLFLCRLYELDQKAISISFPDLNDDEGGTLLCYLWPYEPDDDPDADEKDHDLLPEMVEIKHHVVHSQQDAAKFCKVSERTLQRWTKKFGLRSFRLGKLRIFLENDLLTFMAERVVGALKKPRLNTKNLEEDSK